MAWKQVSAGNGKFYYYDTDTKQTQWNEPEEFEPADPPEAVAEHTQDRIDASWTEARTSEGKAYYYNKLTRETRWERPASYGQSQQTSHPPQQEVADFRHSREDDNYRPRERRRDDRDHGLPQKPNFTDRGRDSGMPWERDQRQESSGFRGPMPVKTDEPEYATYEQAEEAFFKMLRKHNISPDASWEDALREVVRDREYRAIKDPKDRQQAFEKYCQEVRAQEKGKEKERREKLREDFRKMLATHEEIKHYTRWKTARPIIEREAVFKSAGDDDERRPMFDEYIIELKRKHAEEEQSKHQSALRDLDGLLQALITDPDTKWSQAQQGIENNERFAKDDKFRALSKVDILAAFDTHIKTLDRMANDAKQRDKRNHTRRDRQARDGFRDLLHEMQRDGKINAGTKWQNFHALIRDDERYINVVGTQGSSPLDLFWDIIEEEERKLRIIRNAAYDVLEDQRYEMTLETGLNEFEKIMRSDQRTTHMSQIDLGLVYDRLMEKVRKRVEEQQAHTERHQRKAIDALRSVIKHLEPPVRLTDSYDDVVPQLQGYEEFQALSDDKARRSAFDKHIRRLKEKQDDADRERSRRDDDRDDRNHSRRDRERRHRTRTPEVDAYEADRKRAQADRERQYRKASFGLTPPPRDRERDRRDDRDDRYRRHDRHESMSVYDRERREREMERERSYVSRADPRDKQRTLDYGDEDGVGSGGGSVRKRRDSDGSANGRREVKRPRRGRTKTPEPDPRVIVKEDSPALQSGSEEGEIEEL